MSGGSWNYPHLKFADETGDLSVKLNELNGRMHEAGLYDCAIEFQDLSEALTDVKRRLDALYDVLNTVDRVDSGDDLPEQLVESAEKWQRQR